jgi:hypothetical protein
MHVSLLIMKPYYRSGSYQPPPLPLSVDDIGPLYEVEAVLKQVSASEEAVLR